MCVERVYLFLDVVPVLSCLNLELCFEQCTFLLADSRDSVYFDESVGITRKAYVSAIVRDTVENLCKFVSAASCDFNT